MDIVVPKTEPHAIQRARARYGIEVTMQDLAMMEKAVADGAAVLMRRDRPGGVHISDTYLVACPSSGKALVVVVRAGRIVTVLPKDGPLSGKRKRAKFKPIDPKGVGRKSKQPRPEPRWGRGSMLQEGDEGD